MNNAKEMAQKGFNTGFTDTEGHELHVGDYVLLCGDIGKIVFSCGAFGILFPEYVPWDSLEELVRKDSGNRPSFLYNDNFISFWEIVWNLSEDTDEPCLPYVESVTDRIIRNNYTGGYGEQGKVIPDEAGEQTVYYETGWYEPEILGSGGSYSGVTKATSEEEALQRLQKYVANYAHRITVYKKDGKTVKREIAEYDLWEKKWMTTELRQ